MRAKIEGMVARKKIAGKSAFKGLLPRSKKQRRQTELLGGAMVAVFSFVIVLSFAGTTVGRFAIRSPQVAAVVSAVLVDLANNDRTGSGLAALTVNPVLVAAAQAKANDMAAKSYFAHVSPEGVDPWHWFNQAGYKYDYAGENLAVDFSDSGDVNTAWMNSPTHRENILDPHYTQIGIATAEGVYQGRPTTFVVQEFGTPAGTVAAAKKKAATNVPTNPEVIATAQPDSGAILGEQAPSAPAPVKKVPKVVALAPASASQAHIATTAPALAASLAKDSTEQLPWWSFIVGFPRDTLRYAYYVLGLLIIFGLMFDTGFEFHRRHARRATFAGALLVVMCVLFIVADYAVFTTPVLAAVAG